MLIEKLLVDLLLVITELCSLRAITQ